MLGCLQEQSSRSGVFLFERGRFAEGNSQTDRRSESSGMRESSWPECSGACQDVMPDKRAEEMEETDAPAAWWV